MIEQYKIKKLDNNLKSLNIQPPLVSVIVTNYNYSCYLIQCLESVINQTYRNYELILVDDCSTDNSLDLAWSFIDKNKLQDKIKVIRHDKNKGQLESFRTGLKQSHGSFIVFLDADDLLMENFIEVHINVHISFQVVAFTSSDQIQINGLNELIAGSNPIIKHKGELLDVKPRSLHFPFWVWATTSSMMFRRSILEIIMPSNCESFSICADNYVCHFANLIGGSILIPTVHGCYRRHGMNGFSINPIVGQCLPVGDMEKHPKHDLVRKTILKHILENHSSFMSLLSAGGFNHCLALICKMSDFNMLKETHALSKFKIIKILILSNIIMIVNRIKVLSIYIYNELKRQ